MSKNALNLSERVKVIKEFESSNPPPSFEVLAQKFSVKPKYIQNLVNQIPKAYTKAPNETRHETKSVLTLSQCFEIIKLYEFSNPQYNVTELGAKFRASWPEIRRILENQKSIVTAYEQQCKTMKIAGGAENALNVIDRLTVLHECNYKHPKPSISSLAAKYNVSCGDITRVLLEYDATVALLNKRKERENYNRREEQIKFLGMVMYEYLQRTVYHDLALDDYLFQSKATEVIERIALQKFRPSYLWLFVFKKIYGIDDFELKSLKDSILMDEEKPQSLEAKDLVDFVVLRNSGIFKTDDTFLPRQYILKCGGEEEESTSSKPQAPPIEGKPNKNPKIVRRKKVETALQRQQRLEQAKKRRELKKLQESPASRASRIQKQRQKRRDESPKSREARLYKLRQAYEKRRCVESPTSRAARLTKQPSAIQARRRNASPTSRAARLTKKRQVDAKRLRDESPTSRAPRLTKRRKHRNSNTEYKREYRRKRKFKDQSMELTTLLVKHSDAHSSHHKTCDRALRSNTKSALTLSDSDSSESNTDENIFKTADAFTRPDPSNLPAVKIEISPTQLIEYNGPQAIRTEVQEDESMDKSVLTSDHNNLEESNASNLEELEDEANIYLSSDNEAADQSTTHKEDAMDSDTDKLLSIKTEPEMFQKNYGIDISCVGVKIKTEPQMLEEESIEWNAVKSPHPQAIKDESIEIKTEPHHLLENAQAGANSGNDIVIKREIITRENDEREKCSDEQREFMLNQNSIDSCPPCSDINVPAESLGNYKSIFLFECSETVKMENDIHCDQQVSLTKLPRTKEASGHDFFPNDIDTPDEAMKLLEMLAIYAATTENFRAMIVLSELEEALKEESN